MTLLCLDIFHDDEHLYSPRSVQLSNNKVSIGIENKKLTKKRFALECQNFYAKLRNLQIQVSYKKHVYTWLSALRTAFHIKMLFSIWTILSPNTISKYPKDRAKTKNYSYVKAVGMLSIFTHTSHLVCEKTSVLKLIVSGP